MKALLALFWMMRVLYLLDKLYWVMAKIITSAGSSAALG